MNTGMRMLMDVELDQVAGAAPNLGSYHYCSSGPAGEGVYPGYVGCTPTLRELINDFLKAGGAPGI